MLDKDVDFIVMFFYRKFTGAFVLFCKQRPKTQTKEKSKMQKAFIFMIITLMTSLEAYTTDQNMDATPVDGAPTIVGTWKHQGLICVPTHYPAADLPSLPVHNPEGYGRTVVTFTHDGAYKFHEAWPEKHGGCTSSYSR